MPLPLPNLDDRRWADLVDEGRALIPRYAPAWTDHNIHDPGIMLMELFAWLSEAAIYRLNRVGPRHRAKFASLIGFPPRQPRAAQTVLTFAPEPGTLPCLLPAGVEFETDGPQVHPIRFRTLRDVTVAVSVLTTVQVDAGDGDLHDRTRDLREGLPINALGHAPRPRAALYLGFTDLPVGVPLSLAFWFQGPGNGFEERERIVREAAAQWEARQLVLPDIVCSPQTAEPPKSDHLPTPPHHSATLVWEVFAGGADPWMSLEPVAFPARPGAGQVVDNTRALTLDGIVEVNLSTPISQTILGEEAEPRYYLRCRLAEGIHDAPPVLLGVSPNSVDAEQAWPLWQTLPIAAGVTPSGPAPTSGTTTRFKMQVDADGVIKGLSFNPVAPDWPDVLVLDYLPPTGLDAGQIALEMVLAGIGNGRPEQHVALPESPVQAESLRLYTHTGGGWREWTAREDLDGSRRTDYCFVLDATNGEISFGNGERGRVVETGALIFASCRVTRAEAGNVAAGAVVHPADTPLNAVMLAGLPSTLLDQLPHITSNRIPAFGGAAAETLSSAIGRAVETLHAHERLLDMCAKERRQTLDQVDRQRSRELCAPTRAVNLLDLERLALDVPGTRVARARAWADIHPDYPCLQTPGVVTVVVMPDADVPGPEPSQGLIDTIERYLDRRRLVCTRLEVVGPQYLEVGVTARVRAQAFTDSAAVREQIELALDRFLDPRSGGPEGRGWPFGRDIYRSEILQVIDQVPGVDHVLALSLDAWSANVQYRSQCGNLSLCPTWLVMPGWHRIEVVPSSFSDDPSRQHVTLIGGSGCSE